jgi:hypothetical protein
MSGNAPFPIDEELTSITLAYSNDKLIADQVLPRVGVGKQEFKYTKFAKSDAFTVPDTKVGRKSKPNEAEFGGTEATDSVVSHGLDSPIPQDDIVNAAGRFDPIGRATTLLTQLIAVGREKRASDLVFGAGNYATANKDTLAGATQWSHTSSDPINAILAAMDTMVVRPNKIVMGRAVFTKVIQHAKVVAACLPAGGNAASGGVATREALARVLELDEVLVGEGWLNTAKPGQTPVYARVWGKLAALIVQDKLAAPDTPVLSFGYTAEWQNRVAGQIPDPHIGLRGGTRVRVGESVKELLIANDLGFLFIDAVA